MRVEVLISTMNLENPKDLIKKMNIKGPYTIINQCEKITEFDDVNVFSYEEKGLSKSRNKAIENAIEEICVIADDDVVYEDNYLDIIKQAYKENEDADIIIFNVESLNSERKVKKLPRRNSK